jgi:hypothetical protein
MSHKTVSGRIFIQMTSTYSNVTNNYFNAPIKMKMFNSTTSMFYPLPKNVPTKSVAENDIIESVQKKLRTNSPMNVSFYKDGNSKASNTNEVQFIGVELSQDYFTEMSNNINALTLKVNELSKLKDSINFRNLITGGRDHYWKKYGEDFVAEKPGRVEED